MGTQLVAPITRRRRKTLTEIVIGYVAALANQMRRALQYTIVTTGLYEILPRKESRFLSLPPEIRLMIYEFVLCDRTIHIESVYAEWHYFVCRCEGRASTPASSELCRKTNSKPVEHDAQKGAIPPLPPCAFQYKNHSGLLGKTCVPGVWPFGPQAQKSRERLHLDLLAVNKLVYREAAELVFATNVFAFRDDDALRRFVGDRQLARRVRNLMLYVEPRGRFMHLWNGWLNRLAVSVSENYSDNNQSTWALSGLENVRKLQIVVGKCDKLDERCLWTVYGLLVLTRLGVPEVSVDVSLCSGDHEGAQRFGRALEGKLRRPWDGEVQREMRAWREEYTRSPIWLVNSAVVDNHAGGCALWV
ncbi:hypothetical protein BJY00DRAFT_227078 [Aspergillus carlsbadensis]|nr:hypothetical protein BJY00DRAFT_227078 [Aspergillus carlsbadensis]